MRKSKSWIKSLLIVVLALIMVMSLVACNKDNDDKGGNPNPGPGDGEDGELTAAGEYFDTLWKVAAPIGQESIAATDDIALSLGAEIALNTKKKEDGSIKHQVDLGVEVQAVVGRTKSTENNTSVKIRLYDPSDNGHEEILTLYAFANDLDNLYIDFGGKNVKVPHGFASYIWKEVLKKADKTGMDPVWSAIIDNTANAEFNTATIADLLNAKFIGKDKNDTGTTAAEAAPAEKKSINDIINIFTADFNASWTPSKLISGILDTLDLDLVGLLKGIKGAEIALPLLQISSWDDLLTDGKLDVYQVLVGPIADLLVGTPEVTENGGVTTHTGTMSGTVMTLLNLVLPDGIKGMLGSNGKLQLVYTESANRIKDFTIKAELAGLEASVPNGNVNDIIVPELSVKINKLRVEKADTSNQIALKANKTYSENIAINEKFEINVDGTNGIVVEPIDGLNMTDSVPLKGKIVLDVKGMVDLVNPAATNKSAVNVSIDRYWGNDGHANVIEGSYYQGKVAVKFAEALTMKGESGADEKVQGYVFDLDKLNKDSAKFDLVAFLKDKIANFIYTNFEHVNKKVTPPADGGTGAAQAENSSFMDQLNSVLGTVLDVFETAIKMVSTDGNKLEVKTDNILQTVIDFAKAIDSTSTWTIENRQIAIVKTMLNVNAEYDTVNECISKAQTAYETFIGVWNDQNSTPEQKTAAKDALVAEVQKIAVGLVYAVGSQVRFDGVAYTELNAADYAKYKATAEAADFTDAQMQYINNVLAVLATGITVSGDLQNGIHASIVGKIAGTTITISNSIDLIDVVDGETFKDVYAENEAAITKDPSTIGPDEAIWKSLNKPAPSEPGTGGDSGQQGA